MLYSYPEPLSMTRPEETVWLPACILGSEISLSAGPPTYEASGPPDTGGKGSAVGQVPGL